MTDAEDYAEQSIEDLQGDDVQRSAEDDELAQGLTKARLERVRQANRLRGTFFWIACSLAGLTVLTSVGLVVTVLAGRPIETAVAVAFISGLAIETVGILAIVAGYLFPREHRGSYGE